MKRLVTSLLTVSSASFCHAAILASDNFTNSTAGSGLTTVSNTQSSGVGTYNRLYGGTSTSTYSVTTVSGFGSGQVLQITDGDGTYSRAFNNSASFSLASFAVGDFASLSFDVRFTGTFVATPGASDFGFGFVNRTSPGASIVYMNLDAHVASSDFVYRASSFNMSNPGTEFGTPFLSPLAVDTNYRMELRVTRQVSNYLIEYYRDGVLIADEVDALSSTADLTANGIGIRWGNQPGVVTSFDNVLVEVVPEPSSLLMAAVGALGLAARRRR